mmetsp:Transcript_51485/g.59121  ORF Transcript_51485/g.59121 Transcript_51485/m.59121 type:complete len:398 (-) Transcript_51485:162-1355(-)
MNVSTNPLTGGLSFTDLSQNLKDKSKKAAEDVNAHFNPKHSKLTLDEKFKLARSVGEECIEEKELREILEKKEFPICYDGFEPSGRMHIAQGILKTINVNKLVDSGCVFVFWVADWFALLNNKLGGDLEKIKVVGKYFIEIWKAAGMKLSNVQFLWASDEINKRASEYWLMVMDIARKNKIARIKRCATIMGRKEEDDMEVAQLLYPCMQCADIFFLKADICQLGMDQRKVNMLAREYCDDINRTEKPIILSHHMLMGLKENQEKMSKSDPMSAIFMEDSEAEVIEKIKLAFCPPTVVEKNPCLEYLKYIVFGRMSEFSIKREKKHGGDKTYTSYEEAEKDFKSGDLHPDDLKSALAAAINKLLQPVRDHFEKDPEAKELLKLVRSYRVNKVTDEKK